MVRANFLGGSLVGRSGTTNVRFVKEVGFKPVVNKRGGEQSGETEEDEVMGEGMGE